MKRIFYVVGIVVTVVLANCGSDGASEPAGQSPKKDNAASANEATGPLQGEWHHKVSCQEVVGALKRAGVPKAVPGNVRDIFGLDRRPSQTDPCAGVDSTADHTLRFEGGHFGLFAGDELGWEASYEFVDENTFVTGAPDVATFDFRIEGDKLYTQMVEPLKQAPYIATWESAPWERED